ncbi:unnamed protein product [Thlaspi arvense]|uniref:Alpha/beta hydrolase fold-3 domain-containing protein n=1 Tax=Thlaspi arvense TaxID=13288 RepID=A0AAU9RWU8_THLAR|nr:unnamed protein product [Thlaspi arvense]
MASRGGEVAIELPTLIRVYKDGTIQRLVDPPYIPPSSVPDKDTGVSSKDVVISSNVSARLYLPQAAGTRKLPVLVYYHGGGFLIESAFSAVHHPVLNRLAAACGALTVSVEYRKAPEHLLPAAYDDCWEALRWVTEPTQRDPWLAEHGDFGRVFVGGDSSGGNIVHNIVMRVGREGLPGELTLVGAFLTHPYFFGSEPIGSEPKHGFEQTLHYRCWNFVYPDAPGGINNPMISPMAAGAPSLVTLGCRRLFVGVAGEDEIRDRGVWYYEAVKDSGWEGEIELFEIEGEGHAHQVLRPILIMPRR